MVALYVLHARHERGVPEYGHLADNVTRSQWRTGRAQGLSCGLWVAKVASMSADVSVVHHRALQECVNELEDHSLVGDCGRVNSVCEIT